MNMFALNGLVIGVFSLVDRRAVMRMLNLPAQLGFDAYFEHAEGRKLLVRTRINRDRTSTPEGRSVPVYA